MAELKDYQISVYVANLGKYVEGALRGALDLAVGWADPQEKSPETAGLDLALDDGMETTHGR